MVGFIKLIHKMLDSGSYTSTLYPVHVRSSQHPGEIRILRETLETLHGWRISIIHLSGCATYTPPEWALQDIRSVNLADELVGKGGRGNSCTRWILQVGARMTEAALSFASGASNLTPISSTSLASQVAPRAVEDC
jgi:hypothetical protein